MTHEELIEKVARSICMDDMSGDDIFDRLSSAQQEQFIGNAQAAISTILTALQETTEEMHNAAWESDGTDWIGEHKVLNGLSYVWTAMLNASPLAGEKRGAE